MSFLPRLTCWILVSLICVSVSAPSELALAENQSARTPTSRTARAQLTCVATELHLGEVAVGQRRDRLITITNSGRTRLIVLSADLAGTEFRLNGLDLPLTLAAGESFTFGVTFTPQKSGRVDGSISIVSEAPNQTLTIQLSGTGRTTGQLQVTPATIDFGDVSVGSTGSQNVQLTARGADVTISSATASSTNFQLGGPVLPFTIPADHSVPFALTFVPDGSNSPSTVLSFVSDASNPPNEQIVTLRIVGPVQHKVQLSWKASNSKHILGYNIYRGNRSGGPYKKINDVLDPNSRFTDLRVNAGNKYYYVATAVNWTKRESAHSKQIQVVIPRWLEALCH